MLTVLKHPDNFAQIKVSDEESALWRPGKIDVQVHFLQKSFCLDRNSAFPKNKKTKTVNQNINISHCFFFSK